MIKENMVTLLLERPDAYGVRSELIAADFSTHGLSAIAYDFKTEDDFWPLLKKETAEKNNIVVITRDPKLVAALDDRQKAFKDNTIAVLWVGGKDTAMPTTNGLMVVSEPDYSVSKDLETWRDFAALATQPQPHKSCLRKLVDGITSAFRGPK